MKASTVPMSGFRVPARIARANPERATVARVSREILPSVLHAFAGGHAGPVRIVGEPIWAGRTDVEYPACVVHEALINNAFAGRDLAVLCPYAVGALPPPVLADAERTHPELWGLAGPFVSPRFDPRLDID